ncbi:MAG: lactoylglutathione lyase-like lyase [Nocardioidaceae bacterium]|nr:lactoylglutathione lyase-like lyase [Nocardioidaceae bacterium]
MTHPASSLTSIVHVALTVTDLGRSVDWYTQVLGLDRVTVVPHAGGEGVILATPDRRVWWALHRHDQQSGLPFSVRQTGLDHVALLVDSDADLDRWQQHLDQATVHHEAIQPLPDFGMRALVFYDPDGIPVELLAYVEADR